MIHMADPVFSRIYAIFIIYLFIFIIDCSEKISIQENYCVTNYVKRNSQSTDTNKKYWQVANQANYWISIMSRECNSIKIALEEVNFNFTGFVNFIVTNMFVQFFLNSNYWQKINNICSNFFSLQHYF